MATPGKKPAENSVNDLIDFISLKKQLENCAADSPAEHIILLKAAVLAIDDGLKEIYQAGADVNTVVYGRSNLTDQLINIIYAFLFMPFCLKTSIKKSPLLLLAVMVEVSCTQNQTSI